MSIAELPATSYTLPIVDLGAEPYRHCAEVCFMCRSAIVHDCPDCAGTGYKPNTYRPGYYRKGYGADCETCGGAGKLAEGYRGKWNDTFGVAVCEHCERHIKRSTFPALENPSYTAFKRLEKRWMGYKIGDRMPMEWGGLQVRFTMDPRTPAPRRDRVGLDMPDDPMEVSYAPKTPKRKL